ALHEHLPGLNGIKAILGKSVCARSGGSDGIYERRLNDVESLFRMLKKTAAVIDEETDIRTLVEMARVLSEDGIHGEDDRRVHFHRGDAVLLVRQRREHIASAAGTDDADVGIVAQAVRSAGDIVAQMVELSEIAAEFGERRAGAG